MLHLMAPMLPSICTLSLSLGLCCPLPDREMMNIVGLFSILDFSLSEGEEYWSLGYNSLEGFSCRPPFLVIQSLPCWNDKMQVKFLI